MVRLFFIMLTLGALLGAANGFPPVEMEELESLVEKILKSFRPSYKTKANQWKSPMFSVAVSIRFDRKTNKFDINQVLGDAENIKDTISKCNVYSKGRVVAATVLRWPDVLEQCPDGNIQWPDILPHCPGGVKTWKDVSGCNINIKGRADHAEYRVLTEPNTFLKHPEEDDLLLIYVYASPCDQKCASKSDRQSIIRFLKPLKQLNVVFVFSKVFRPRSGDINEENPQKVLTLLGNSISKDKIFRCDKKENGMTCENCFNGENVKKWCYTDNSKLEKKGE